MPLFGAGPHRKIFPTKNPSRRSKTEAEFMSNSSDDVRPLRHISTLMTTPSERYEKPQSQLRPSRTTLDGRVYNNSGHWRSLSKDATLYYSATALSVLIPLISLAIWLGVNSNRWKESEWSAIQSDAIGGRLTQPQAKAVDLLCSALIAPLILGAFNLVWFSCARVAVVNEKQSDKDGVPLACLVEVSSTTGGSYDVLKLSTLLAPRTKRLVTLGLLVIVSAIAKSALGNVIAYEAYNEDSLGGSSPLRLLSDRQLAVPNSLVSQTFVGTWGFNTQQRSSFANQFSGLMTGLSISNASSQLTADHAYIMTNVTGASLELPQTVSTLHKLPGSRWSVSCEPFVPDTFTVIQMGSKSVQFSMTRGTTDLVTGNYPGDIATIKNAFNEVYPFMLFPPADGSSAVLAFTTSFNLSDQRYDSEFGTITPKAFNMTALGFNSTKAVMSVWAISCKISRQEATLDLIRSPTGEWLKNMTSLSVSEATTDLKYLRMQQLQLSLNYQAPDVTLPGLGPALARSADPCIDATLTGTASEITSVNCSAINSTSVSFSTLAQNFLYASAETERIAYEVAATNTSRDTPEAFYSAANTAQTLHYRITYVPVILFVGIGCILAAALITVALVWSVWGTVSARSFRQVDVLRLVVDALAGLRETGRRGVDDTRGVYDHIKGDSNAGLVAWAKDYPVKYSAEPDTGLIGLSRARAVSSERP
ncbi:uncharacterized protein A1O9_10926 [Exophiala aquamarina CBS 119918]|uniref:Uncharacterized protein n=1 Tax=Exophiala aquamarina CBS 119918 TaxID=1182545 RepID=A0A072P164_9EURO|nr:uncharacterized protein A1O9_10926 [Exophiala aquamarina CBS 119918]KEF53018.1 hypothetical protein A1O9_10926 [Exophiala aquamarina CBS 119918]